MAVDRDVAINMAKKGLSASQIAKLYDAKEAAIKKILDEAKEKKVIPLTQSDRTDLRKEIAGYVASGKSPEDATKKYSVTLNYITRACKEHGVALPDKRKGRITEFKIVTTIVEHPDMAEIQIAEMLGITKQYVNMARSKANRDGLFLAIEMAKQRAVEEAVGGVTGKQRSKK